jgi:RNA polymerase sigma-70 factor (ECF subfamily)
MNDPHGSGGSNGSQGSLRSSLSLLARVKANDPAAWDRLVTLYAPVVLGWCRRWDLQEQDAADVFQEVFSAVATHIAGFHRDQPGDTFRGWLRTIAMNKVRDHFRRLGRDPQGAGGTDALTRLAQLPSPAPIAEEEPRDDSAATNGLFRRALELIRDQFEERTWQAFWRTAVEGRAAADVAADLRMTAGAVRVAKSRVLQRLREELGDLIE